MVDEPTNENSHVVFDRTTHQAGSQPEFKPGSTSYTQFGEQVLNANVPWKVIVEEIMQKQSLQIDRQILINIARATEISLLSLEKILTGSYEGLTFREGARLLGLHCQYFPETI